MTQTYITMKKIDDNLELAQKRIILGRAWKMNRTVYQIAGKNGYYQLNKRKIWFIGAGLLLIILLCSVLFITKTVTAQREGERIKLVTSIEIKKGDTLWSIATRYMSEEYDDLNEYIEEIKNSNGMVSDEIHFGNFIIVPYYTDATDKTDTGIMAVSINY